MTKWGKEMDARELAKTLPDIIDRDGSSIETAELDAEDIHGICAALTTQADEVDRLRKRLTSADKLLNEALAMARLSDPPAKSGLANFGERVSRYFHPMQEKP